MRMMVQKAHHQVTEEKEKEEEVHHQTQNAKSECSVFDSGYHVCVYYNIGALFMYHNYSPYLSPPSQKN